MPDEQEIRQDICRIGRRMYDKGFVAANDGNISCRLGDGTFLITPTGVSKGFMKPEDIAVVDDRGRQISGPMARTTEALLHLTIYRQLPEVNAVAHCHAPHATAFAIAGVPIPSGIMPEAEVLLGPVPTVGYDNPGSESLSDAIRPHLGTGVNTILLANHGPVAFDKTLDLAFFHLETLDMYCRVLLLVRQIGSVRRLNEDRIRQLLAQKQRLGLDDPRLHGADVYPPALDEEFLSRFLGPAAVQKAPDATGPESQ